MNHPVPPSPPRLPRLRMAVPGVDVVIPSYNRRTLLPLAIASIRAQTRPVERIIVADDGSTDGTREWVREAAREDPRITLLELDHGGANRARNAGIAASTAPWIAFLDSDDEWEADKLERQFALLDRHPDRVGLFTGFRLVGGAVERVHLPRDNPSLFDLRCANVLSSTSSAVLRGDVVRRLGGFDPSLPSCQDWDMWFRMRRQGPLGVVREPLVRFNSGPHERITTNAEKVLAGHHSIFKRLTDDIRNQRELSAVRARHRLVEADIRRRFGAYGPALALAARSFAERPSRWALMLAWRAGTGALATRKAPAEAHA